MNMSLTAQHSQHALGLWEHGHRKFQHAMPTQRQELQKVIEAIKTQLTPCASMDALTQRYFEDNESCLKIAKRVQPERLWCWRLTFTEDAAYYLRAQELQTNTEDAARAGDW